MKELLYEFNNKKTTKLGGGKYRFEMQLTPSFDVFRDGNVIEHTTRNGAIKYLVPDNYEYKITGGNFEDVFKNVNSKTFTYEIETDLALDLQDNQEAIDTLVGGKRIKYAEEVLNFRKNNRIVSKLRAIRGFDSSGKIVAVKSISRIGNKVNIKFEKEVAIVDPQWTDQPGAEGKDAMVSDGAGADMNYGDKIYLYIGTLADGRHTLSYIEFVDFLDNIPENAIIDSAYIYLWYYTGGLTGALSIRSFRPLSLWEEMVLTWNTRDGGAPYSSGVSPTDGVAVPITALVQAYYAETYTDYGFAVAYVTEPAVNNFVYYCSSDFGTAAKRPKMEVNYTVPIQATASSGLKLNESTALKTIFNPIVINEIKLNESSASKTIYNPVLVDGLKLNEEAVKDYFLSIIDYLKVNDLPEVNCSFSLTLSDSLNINELIDSLNIDLSENLSISDVAQSLGHYFMSISENFKIEDVNVTYRWGKVYFSFRVRKTS